MNAPVLPPDPSVSGYHEIEYRAARAQETRRAVLRWDAPTQTWQGFPEDTYSPATLAMDTLAAAVVRPEGFAGGVERTVPAKFADVWQDGPGPCPVGERGPEGLHTPPVLGEPGVHPPGYAQALADITLFRQKYPDIRALWAGATDLAALWRADTERTALAEFAAAYDESHRPIPSRTAVPLAGFAPAVSGAASEAALRDVFYAFYNHLFAAPPDDQAQAVVLFLHRMLRLTEDDSQ